MWRLKIFCAAKKELTGGGECDITLKEVKYESVSKVSLRRRRYL